MRNVTTQRVLAHVQEPLHRNAYALVLNTVLVAAAGFVYWALAARLFTPSDLGVAAALVSTITFLSGLAQLNLRPGLARFVPVSGGHARRLVASAYVAASLVAIAASVVLLVDAPVLGDMAELRQMRGDIGVAATLVIAVVAWTLFALQDGVLIGLRRSTWVPVENLAFSLAKLGALALLAAVGVGAVGAILASWIVPMILAVLAINALLALRLLPSHGLPASVHEPITLRRIVPFLAGDYVASLLNLTYVTLPPVVVVATAGPEAGGYFYVVWIIVTSMILVPRQLTTSLVVEAARSPDELAHLVRSTLLQLLRLVVPAALAVAVFGRFILLAFDDAYADAGTGTLALLALAVIPYSINALGIGVLRVRALAPGIIAIEAALAATILVPGVALAARVGPVGLAATWLVGQLVVGLAVGLAVVRPALRDAVAEPQRS